MFHIVCISSKVLLNVSFQTKYLISKYYCVFDLNVHEILQLDVKQPIMKDLCNKMLYAIVDHLLCIVVGMHTYIAMNNQNTQKIKSYFDRQR